MNSTRRNSIDNSAMYKYSNDKKQEHTNKMKQKDGNKPSKTQNKTKQTKLKPEKNKIQTIERDFS